MPRSFRIGRRWHIVDVAPLPLARGQGIGTDVVSAVVRGASDAGGA